MSIIFLEYESIYLVYESIHVFSMYIYEYLHLVYESNGSPTSDLHREFAYLLRRITSSLHGEYRMLAFHLIFHNFIANFGHFEEDCHISLCFKCIYLCSDLIDSYTKRWILILKGGFQFDFSLRQK